MFNQLYEKVKKYIKENYKFLLILLISYLILTFPLPYYIYTTGGTMNINDKVTVDNAYPVKGSFNFAYVTELRATIPTYLLSNFIPSWEVTKIEEYKLNKEEDEKDISYRNQLSLQEANQSAIKVAFMKAKKDFSIQKKHYYVVYISEESNTNLKIGDEIIEADGQELTDLSVYQQIIQNHAFNDKISLTIERGNNKLNKEIEVKEIAGQKMTGISISTIYDYNTNPKVKLNFSKAESGPSGGLMLTLAIYNQLIKEDITHGMNIVGTGTIDEDGNVGEIGGVSYKLRGAVKGKADLFLVPKGNNYKECKKIKEEENLNIKIIPVGTFEEAIDKLNNITK